MLKNRRAKQQQGKIKSLDQERKFLTYASCKILFISILLYSDASKTW